MDREPEDELVRGKALVGAGQLEAAVAALEAAVAAAPDEAAPLAELGIARKLARREVAEIERARDELERALARLAPGGELHGRATVVYALTLHDLGRVDAAVAVFEGLAAAAPTPALAELAAHYARAYRHAGR